MRYVAFLDWVRGIGLAPAVKVGTALHLVLIVYLISRNRVPRLNLCYVSNIFQAVQVLIFQKHCLWIGCHVLHWSLQLTLIHLFAVGIAQNRNNLWISQRIDLIFNVAVDAIAQTTEQQHGKQTNRRSQHNQRIAPKIIFKMLKSRLKAGQCR